MPDHHVEGSAHHVEGSAENIIDTIAVQLFDHNSDLAQLIVSDSSKNINSRLCRNLRSSHGSSNHMRFCISSGMAGSSFLLFCILVFGALHHVTLWDPYTDHFSRLSRGFFPQQVRRSSNVVTSPQFNCSQLGLTTEKVIIPENQYHVFPTSDLAINNMCQSSYQQHCFRKNTGPQFHPSSEFLRALRDYEAFHERCTRGVNLTELAKQGHAPVNCTYLVWRTMDGMGNQLLSLVSAFIYSMLTNRAMLIGTEAHIEQHLCNPFPMSSWVVPQGFPSTDLRDSSKRLFTWLQETLEIGLLSADCAAGRSVVSKAAAAAPDRLTVLISCCDERRDHQFFCPSLQTMLSGVKWLFYQSHEYTLAGFYFIPDFKAQLKAWFPDKNPFMHASRYLLNPNNEIWDQITAFYRSHMDGAYKKVGLQPRSWKGDYSREVNAQIQRCAVEEGLLPKVQEDRTQIGTGCGHNISVLVTSLRSEYHQNLHLEYSPKANDAASCVHVFSASNESFQRTGDIAHDAKAIIDIWLLSFVDELVITSSSTFGSTASGLSGIVPYVFLNYGLNLSNERACARSNLVGPCFIVHPRNQPCDLDPPRSSIFDAGFTIPEIRYCEHNSGIGIQNM